MSRPRRTRAVDRDLLLWWRSARRTSIVVAPDERTAEMPEPVLTITIAGAWNSSPGAHGADERSRTDR
jgi:hypothetical protein